VAVSKAKQFQLESSQPVIVPQRTQMYDRVQRLRNNLQTKTRKPQQETPGAQTFPLLPPSPKHKHETA
jgi:hypothetical protein